MHVGHVEIPTQPNEPKKKQNISQETPKIPVMGYLPLWFLHSIMP